MRKTNDQPFKLTREEKGYKLTFQKGALSRIDENTYTVKSQSGNGSYVVIQTENGWKCACPDHTFRHVKCKHIIAIEYSQELRREIEAATKTIISEINSQACLFCNSENIVKFGIRHNVRGDIQKYRCNDCSRYFTINLGFEKMHATPQQITTAMQLYFTGESLRNVQRFLRLQGVNVAHMTVYRWIKRYVNLMQKYLDKIAPNVSDTWRTDELYLKVKGNSKYLYALMDDSTRFWLAQQVADTKYTHDVRPLFRKGSEFVGRKPATLISDGAQNFHEAYIKEYRTLAAPRTQHIQHIHMKGDKNNNKMERLNGEIRDREKVMRGVKKMDTPILKGYQLYHNYFREHEGLNGKT
ncbi:MAG: DDE-type integrase/transposase/recombinase, partial [Nitrososphaera sp.]